ncbi:MAG: hypothetical protein H6721_18400 [Sandaracinus sp.]|nr:hypothetical protein [Sandaracinus sp.]MCB9634096.1 hypothetical protein [Sandaracinus sp.]
MDHPRHSILPVDHWTSDLEDDDLRGLADRHHVSFEVHPHELAYEGEVRRDGWVVDLYGERSEADAELHLRDAAAHLDDVLRAIARSVVPDDTHSVHIELSPFTGAVRVDPHRGFAEEVRLRMTIEAMTTARASLVDGVEIDRLATITQRLEELGCRRR